VATFWKLYDRLEMAVALVAVLAMVIAVLVAAVGRSIGLPVASAPQFAQLFLIWSCMLGADLTMRSGDHIRVTALPELLPPVMRKALAFLSVALILGFIVWKGYALSMGNWQRPLATSGLSYGLVTLALPVGAALIGISILRRWWEKGLLALFEPDDTNPETVL
jgi:TRAP-type C4-dicarboxylate transport system permease small subunit